ncbi:hypothetical protein BDV97DRAFT_128998 [Delphinella strobiligena]|nr:hypothetical protein BDV97DRAFT_128998 [Delphinella strobiligena]
MEAVFLRRGIKELLLLSKESETDLHGSAIGHEQKLLVIWCSRQSWHLRNASLSMQASNQAATRRNVNGRSAFLSSNIAVLHRLIATGLFWDYSCRHLATGSGCGREREEISTNTHGSRKCTIHAMSLYANLLKKGNAATSSPATISSEPVKYSFKKAEDETKEVSKAPDGTFALPV